MKNKYQEQIDNFMEYAKMRNTNEPEFLQAVKEVAEAIIPYIAENPKYQGKKLLERMIEPERAISFRVPWVDDKGDIQVNRGYRIQFNSAIGPYKGGLRFHPTVNQSILKFLGFEQIFKNALTTLPMGGGKGGSDFNPKGKSDAEVMRFAQSFMTELHRHIGPNIDVPAGDIGVGGREIGFLFGQYKRLTKDFSGVLTGKGLAWGGSLIRPEATGFGVVYFADQMLKAKGDTLKDKVVAVSGFGNVAWGAITKAGQLGAKVVTISGPDGYIYDPEGITGKKIDYMLRLRATNNDVVAPYAEQFPEATFYAGKKPWEQKVDIALPCATQNELQVEDAQRLIDNGVLAVVEGANMPSTPDAIKVYKEAKILYSPGKASNAGGVAVSGLEMSQNSMRYNWTSEEVDAKLKEIMKSIHENAVKYGKTADGWVDYEKGANIAGFVKVADAMLAQGIV